MKRNAFIISLLSRTIIRMMKSTRLLLCILMGFITQQVAAQKLPETYVVVIGQVQGFKDGDTFSIMESDGQGGSMFFYNTQSDDNGTVKDGRFTAIYPYKRNVPGRFELILPNLTAGTNLPLIFYANPGDTVRVKGNGVYPCQWEVHSDATQQKDWSTIQQATLSEELAYQKAMKDHYDYRMYRRNTEMDEKEWDRTGKILKQKTALVDSMNYVLYLARLEALKTLPASDVWMQTLILTANSSTPKQVKDKIRELYNLRMNDINRKPDGKRISTMLYPYPTAELGKPMVDGELMDLDGNIHRLSDFKGKYILIDFWSTNCGPCIAALPEIEKFVKRNANVEVISLCLSQYNSWRTHPWYQNLPWHNMNDGGGWMGLAKSYNVHAVPTYVLISPDGTYIKQWVGKEIFDEGGTLEKFINQHNAHP